MKTTIERHPYKKLPYKKSEAVKLLEAMAMEEARRLHPTCPHLAPRTFRDDSANGLTKCVIGFLTFSGWQAERINCTGKMIDNTKVVTDVLGDRRAIGSVKWLPTSGQKGTADISATINGRSVKIEVKMKDRQSENQKRYEEQVIRAGGLYWLVRSFAEFLSFYNGIV